MCTINKVHLFYFKKNGTSHAFIDTMGYTHSIKELGSFGYILLLVSLKPSPLSPCVCIKIFSILKKKKKKEKKKKRYYGIHNPKEHLLAAWDQRKIFLSWNVNQWHCLERENLLGIQISLGVD